MPLVSEGDVDGGAAAGPHATCAILAEAVRLGYRIVCTEPAAVTCITHDYPLLARRRRHGPRSSPPRPTPRRYLWELHREGRLRLDFRPVPARRPLPRPLPLADRGRRHEPGRAPAAARARPHGAGGRPRLLGHGRHVRPGPRALPREPPRRAGARDGDAQRRRRGGRYRVQRLPDTNGAGHDEADRAPGETAREGLWSARWRRSRTDSTACSPPRAAGSRPADAAPAMEPTDARRPPWCPATLRSPVRRHGRGRRPPRGSTFAWQGRHRGRPAGGRREPRARASAPLLARSAFAIGGRYVADDDAGVPAGADVAVIPPVSGG